MPLYEFQCKKCNKPYEAITSYDETGKYKGIACPKCKSKTKTKLMSKPNAAGTRNKMNNFGYRAGSNMEKAQGERRAAEALSHVGSNPYGSFDDSSMDEGIHDADGPIRLS